MKNITNYVAVHGVDKLMTTSNHSLKKCLDKTLLAVKNCSGEKYPLRVGNIRIQMTQISDLGRVTDLTIDDLRKAENLINNK